MRTTNKDSDFQMQQPRTERYPTDRGSDASLTPVVKTIRAGSAKGEKKTGWLVRVSR